MKVKNGDALKAFEQGFEVLAHCCNCQQNFGSGVARTIRETFPAAFEVDKADAGTPESRFGLASFAKLKPGVIANLYGQLRYGGGVRNLNYEKFYTSLVELHKFMIDNDLNKLAVPYNIGCDRAKGDWKIVSAMIDAVFPEEGFEVCAFKFEG